MTSTSCGPARSSTAADLFGDEDDAEYRRLLSTSCRACGTQVLVDCLMPNHVHLILVPVPVPVPVPDPPAPSADGGAGNDGRTTREVRGGAEPENLFVDSRATLAARLAGRRARWPTASRPRAAERTPGALIQG